MTSFRDGPAKGQHLRLKRAPVFLRVTEESGKWDALDQIGDTPRKGEKVFAYKMHGEPYMVHVNARCGMGGWFMGAEYAYIEQQPEDAILRCNSQWKRWCEAKAAEDSRSPKPGGGGA